MVYLGTSITSGASHHRQMDSERNGHSGGGDILDRDGDSSGDEEREGRIRVGKDYQANTPNFIPTDQRRPDQCPERALLVWSPCPTISGGKLDEYVQVSKEKYGYNAEQALGMLFWHKHDLDRAIQDLANFTPFPDEWTVEDKVLFEQAFQFHGKSFHRIRQMLPDKSIAQLVKYYYGWKKTRTRTSLMDRQARKLQAQREEQGVYGEGESSKAGSGTGSAGSTPAPSSNTSAAPSSGQSVSDDEPETEDTSKPKCFNCGILCHVTQTTPKGQMCGTCHQHWTRTGHVRPTTGPARKDGSKGAAQKYNALMKNASRPPKGMYINHDDLVSLATGPTLQGDQLLKSMDREIVSYKRVVQNNKQLLSSLSRRTVDRNVDPYRIPDPATRINARWTNEELLLGVQGVRKFGKNFGIIAEVIGTKTESHVRSFFVNYRRRYNLDTALKEYEAEHGPSGIDTPPADPTQDGNEPEEAGTPPQTDTPPSPRTTSNGTTNGNAK